MFQGTIGCIPNSIPMVFIVFSRDGWGIITHRYPLYRAYIGISHRGTLVGVTSNHPLNVDSCMTIPVTTRCKKWSHLMCPRWTWINDSETPKVQLGEAEDSIRNSQEDEM